MTPRALVAVAAAIALAASLLMRPCLRIRVRRGSDPASDRAAAVRARELVGFLRTLLRTLRAGDAEDRALAWRLRRRLAGGLVVERDPRQPVDAFPVAASLNKGRELVLCLRDASGALQDPDATRRILVHELAHVGVDAAGHGAAFRRADARLLAAARRDAAWRDPSPYASFCGVRVAP